MLKKNIFTIVVIVLLGSQLLWLAVAPSSFKVSWSKNPLIAQIIREHALVNEKSKAMTISYYFPHFAYFADIVLGVQKPESELMDGYHDGKPYIFRMYYQKAATLFPNNDDAQALLAFTQYYQKDIPQAIESYQRSLDRNPYFFWGYYNLGVIYFQQKDYSKSAQMLSKAVSLNPEITLRILYQSALYRQIWKSLPNPQATLQVNLEQGRQDAGRLLAVCFLRIKTGNIDNSLEEQVAKQVVVRLF